MQKNEHQKVVYYSDELNDDFASSEITPVKINEDYKYIHKSPLWKLCAFIVYRAVFLIPGYIYAKVRYGLKIENRSVLKKAKKQGYFLYSNHTQEVLDTFFPTFITFPRRVYVIANAKNVSIRFMKTLNKLLGALPIPDTIKGMSKFKEAIKYYIDKKNVISIYPEAHVWPYYTKIRGFKSVSFEYPYELDKPCYSATTTYQKDAKGKAKIVIYVDGPFYADKTLPKKEAKEKLRNTVLDAMKIRSENSNIEVIKYIKKNKSELKGDRGIYD